MKSSAFLCKMAELMDGNSVVIKSADMDVYETTDLPEDDQHVQMRSEPTLIDCVEPIDVSVHQAFAQFRNKVINAVDVDFSDNISRIQCPGYIANAAIQALDKDFEGYEESLEQKCQRLQQELQQLAKEVELNKGNSNRDTSVDSISARELINLTDYLKQQMIDLSKKTQLDAPSSLSLIDPQEALKRRLLTELNGFHAPSSKPPVTLKTAPLAADDSDHVNYQLFYRPEQAKFCRNARIADFEQRIERLEAVLGQNPEKLALLTAEVLSKTLMSSLCMLLAKMKVLDSGYLELMEPRLTSVYHRVSRTAEKKEAADQADKFIKITSLFDTVKKWDSMANAVPHIVDRLIVLKAMQIQALQMSQTLFNLGFSQRQMTEGLSRDAAMLKQFQELLVENAAKMESNTRNLEERLKAVRCVQGK